MNAMLEKHCADHGIALEFSVPHTPEQNGITKRTNQKILDKGRAIMKDTRAPDFLWVDPFSTVVYTMNQTISARAGEKTPFEAFFGRKPNVSHMRVWFSDIYLHQPKDLRAQKIGEHGHPSKLLGYPENSAGYKAYDPLTHKVEIV